MVRQIYGSIIVRGGCMADEIYTFRFPIIEWIRVKLHFHKNLVIYPGYIPVSTLLFGTLFDREKESKKCSKKVEKKFAPILFWNTFLVGDKLFLSRSSDDTFFRPVMEQKSLCFVRTIVYHRTYLKIPELQWR